MVSRAAGQRRSARTVVSSDPALRRLPQATCVLPEAVVGTGVRSYALIDGMGHQQNSGMPVSMTSPATPSAVADAGDVRDQHHGVSLRASRMKLLAFFSSLVHAGCLSSTRALATSAHASSTRALSGPRSTASSRTFSVALVDHLPPATSRWRPGRLSQGRGWCAAVYSTWRPDVVEHRHAVEQRQVLKVPGALPCGAMLRCFLSSCNPFFEAEEIYWRYQGRRCRWG